MADMVCGHPCKSQITLVLSSRHILHNISTKYEHRNAFNYAVYGAYVKKVSWCPLNLIIALPVKCTRKQISDKYELPKILSSGARFTKYLMTILRLSYDNTKVTIDLLRTSNLQKHPTKGARFFLGTIHLQTCKIVLDSVRKLAYDIPKKFFSTFYVTIVSQSYDKLTIILRKS